METMKIKNVLLTGAGGKIGRPALQELVKAGFSVRALEYNDGLHVENLKNVVTWTTDLVDEIFKLIEKKKGKKVTGWVALKFIDNLFALKKEELIEIDGIGEKVADSVISYLQDPINQEEIKLLLAHGVVPQKVSIKKLSIEHPFYGKTFVLTGTLKSMTRDEAKQKIRANGGDISSSVSKNTDFILIGESPGSKYDKAKKLGVKILTETNFQNLLE